MNPRLSSGCCLPRTFLVLLSAFCFAAAASAANYFYDAAGRLSAVKNANGQLFYYQYDAAGNLLGVDTDIVTPAAFVGVQTLGVGMQVELDITGGNPMGAHVYSTSALPAGLKIDPVTGKITGLISAKAGNYTVTYWATAGKQKSPVQQLTIQVTGFPAAMTGTFDAMMNDVTTGKPVGRLEVTVVTAGTCTGKLLYIDGKPYSLTGPLTLESDSSKATISASMTRSAGLPPLVIVVTILPNNTCSATLSSRNILMATSSEGRKRGVFTAASPAPWQGTYTMVLEPSVWTPNTPDGISYASVKIANTGTMTITGKAADGMPLTGSAPCSSGGIYLHWMRPHNRPDSYFGGKLAVELIPASNPAAYRATVTSGNAFFWRKSANAADKSYRAGFGPLDINVTMLPWTPPTVAQNILTRLGLPVNGEFNAIIQGAGLDSTGAKSVTVVVPPPQPAGTNNFVDRPTIGATGGTTTSVSNIGANKEVGEPNHNSNTGGASLWWTWTPALTGTATINTDGSSFDTVMAVYTGTVVNALTFVASDDDAGAGNNSQVIFAATAGTTYQIAVDGYSGATGNIILNVTAPAPPPTVLNTYNVPAWLALTAAGKISTAENAVALTGTVALATGVFTASFNIQDTVIVATKPKIITRKVTFEGVYLINPGGDIGAGFVLVPPLVATDPILSGYGVFTLTPPRAKYPPTP